MGKARCVIHNKKSNVRDYKQAAANKGIGGLVIVLHVLFTDYDFYPIYVGSIAAVTADIWGNEIGLLQWTETYSLTSWNRVEHGSNA